MSHHCRLVALSPQRNRSKEGSVRLDQDPMARGEHRGIPDRLGLRISKIPGEREVKSRGKRALGLLHRPREAMHDAAKAGWRPVLGDQGEQVFPRIGRTELLLGLRSSQLTRSAVNQDGFAKFGGQPHLSNKGCLLNPNLRIVEVVVIQTDLTNRDASPVERKAGQPAQGFAGGAGSLLGMNADACVDGWQSWAAGGTGDLQSLVHRSRAFANADGKNRLDPGGIGAAQNLVALRWGLGIKVE